MPSFIKEELKKKDEQKLEDMQQEIDEAREELAAEEMPNEDVAKAEAGQETAAADPLAAAQQKAADLEAALQEKNERLVRLQADFENFRRRTAKEREELAAVVTQNILRDMLPLLDNFERALATENADGGDFRKGIEMIYAQLQEALKKNGLEVIDTNDKMFDPNYHQAVLRIENPDMMDGMIAAELQKGYMAKGHVIRPSMVQVVGN